MTGGATWLITGGSGFFAKRFARYLLDYAHPHAVRLLARSESRLAEALAWLDDPRVRGLLGDVRDSERLKRALSGVEYVVHAAALKRVDDCEQHPSEAVETNVVGTRNVLEACLACGVHRAVFLSTDKAAAPDTFYGATKLLAERLWIAGNVYAAGTPTRFCATRYGNVIGSTGSVIERWQHGERQMTDPQATRFWMTPRQACDLVMLAFNRSQGGEVFLPKLSGASLETVGRAITDEAFTVTELRGAEKLHERLLTDEELRRTYDVEDGLVMLPPLQTWGARHQLPELIGVPDYRSNTVPQFTVEQMRAMIAESQ